MQLRIEDLSSEKLAPFGTVIEQPGRSSDAGGPGWKWWGEIVNMAGGEQPYAIGYLDLDPAPLRFDWAERHMHTDELLVPLGASCLLYVGPPEHPSDPDHLPALEHFRVFKVRQGQAVLLKPGVWHGAPLAIDRQLNVLVILLQKTAQQDIHVAHFEQTPVVINQ